MIQVVAKTERESVGTVGSARALVKIVIAVLWVSRFGKVFISVHIP